MGKLSIGSLSKAELQNIILASGGEKYRAAQLFRWLHKERVDHFDKMTNVPARLRTNLAELSEITVITEEERVVSAKDGSMKFLFALPDGERVEAVLLKDGDRVTGCISTQAGCRMGCRFCATAGVGFKRHLNAAEILLQLAKLEEAAYDLQLTPEGRLTGIVLMGMGEPLDNFDNVYKALEIMMDEEGYGYSHRRITLSTAGVTARLPELFTLETPVNLAVSLNAATQEKRASIMPITNKYPLEGLMDALRQLPLMKRKRITFEYVLLGGLNDSPEDAKALIKLVKGLPAKINLIRYNGGGESDLKKPAQQDVLAFQKVLTDAGFTAFIRKSLGADIFGACGQLRAGYQGKDS